MIFHFSTRHSLYLILGDDEVNPNEWEKALSHYNNVLKGAIGQYGNRKILNTLKQNTKAVSHDN